MSEFIGTFSAPGAGEIGVLGFELIKDRDTGVIAGVARLEKRPCYGSMTRCIIDMPATAERKPLSFSGIWTMLDALDDEGCNITLEGVEQVQAPALDESTAPHDLDWGEVRSACAAKDWRRAWEVVGTYHEGEATPGEVYIFSNARRASCTSAALMAWRSQALPLQTAMLRYVEASSDVETHTVRKSIALKLGTNEPWTRIKGIAAWESSAAAQYSDEAVQCSKHAHDWALRVECMEMSVGGVPIRGMAGDGAGYYDESAHITPEMIARVAAMRGEGETNGAMSTTRNPFVAFNDAEVLRELSKIRAMSTTTRDALARFGLNNPAPRGPARRRR